jgi:hypothetical protein
MEKQIQAQELEALIQEQAQHESAQADASQDSFADDHELDQRVTKGIVWGGDANPSDGVVWDT